MRHSWTLRSDEVWLPAPCPHCGRRQALHPTRVDARHEHVRHRCIGCDQWYAVERDDSVVLSVFPRV